LYLEDISKHENKPYKS